LTRGRPPYETIREAMELAETLGKVREGPDTKQVPAHFTVYLERVTLYARVKRPQARIDGPIALLDTCTDDVLLLKRIPFTPVVIHEVWAGLRNGTWQFFRILPGTIVEIQTSGLFERTPEDCEHFTIPPDPSEMFLRNTRAIVQKDPALACPIFEYLKGRVFPT
jgi:hypothetical protein